MGQCAPGYCGATVLLMYRMKKVNPGMEKNLWSLIVILYTNKNEKNAFIIKSDNIYSVHCIK
jgi:hypothetical protein